MKATLALMLVAGCAATQSQAQAPNEAAAEVPRKQQIQELRRDLEALSKRLAALEAEDAASATAAISAPQTQASVPTATNSQAPTAAVVPPPAATGSASAPESTAAAVLPSQDTSVLGFFRGTTLNFGVDGYYDYNFNAPIGRVNLLRAYDVTSNSFNINQANLIVEHLSTAEERFGGRIDLQFGQATETLQGSYVNEQRPQVWRSLYQAYGSYLAPIGSGLQIDFGKWASSLGNEGNYTKDQITYSRSYSFNYLPFYHVGLRANYNLTPKVNVAYWLVNGANDTEDTNGFKSQAFLFTLNPASSVTWNVNYYFGQEARDVLPTANPGLPSAPVQPGLPTANINPAPNGREHIFDTYATWKPTQKVTVVGEADYVLNRSISEQKPGRVVIGSVMAKYALLPKWNLGARAEYFDDRGGLFSGTTQALKEVTLITDHTFAPGFLARAEYRRDFSNQPFFLTDTAGVLVHAQTTATLGLVFWWGMKQGTW